jgi:hypothetical protein
VTRPKGTSRITPVGSGGARRGVVTPGLALPPSVRKARQRAATKITRERECEGCRETHTEVWCNHHKRWELEGTEGEAAAAHG